MRKSLTATLLLMLWFAPAIHAASAKTHVVTLGKPMTVKLFVGPDEAKSLDIKVRGLYVDGKLKEFTTGETHDVTDRNFVVQRAYRVNDSLPHDERNLPRWKWQRGSWMLVDRTTGRVSPIRLPQFDAFYSDVAWYRDYAAYCGISDSGEKLYAVVTQVASRKPIVNKLLRPVNPTGEPECARPAWERQPSRVTFTFADNQKLTFTIHGRAADLAAPTEAAPSDDDSD